jgi:broad specificity phosphatase PhoE
VASAVVHLLRHGEVHNPSGVLYGRLPGFRLSDGGLAMAERVAAVMGQRDIVRVVSSPLERAQQTAAPLAAARGVRVETDERLIEAGNLFEGRTFGVGDNALAHPSSWWRLRNPFRPSWGEPYDVVAARMLAAVRDVAASVQGHEALLVSHQLPIWTARNAAEGHRLWHNPRHRQCSLASVTSLTVSAGQVVAVGYTEPARDLLPAPGTFGQLGA